MYGFSSRGSQVQAPACTTEFFRNIRNLQNDSVVCVKFPIRKRLANKLRTKQLIRRNLVSSGINSLFPAFTSIILPFTQYIIYSPTLSDLITQQLGIRFNFGPKCSRALHGKGQKRADLSLTYTRQVRSGVINLSYHSS